MNFVEEFILFIFALLAMLTINSRYSFGQELTCAQDIIPHIDAKYLFIGEDHRDLKSKDLISKYAPDFKKMGFDSIFVEYIESKDQQTLDEYNQNPTAIIREKVFRTYGLPGDWGYDAKPYLNLTDSLSLNKINIYGLDRRSDLRITMNSEQKMSIRDQHMFNVVSEFIENYPDKKIIFFNGSSHSFVNRNLNSPSFYELFIRKYKTSKIKNIKIDFYWLDSLSSERFYLSSKKQIPSCDSDFLIYNTPLPFNFNHYIFEDTKTLLPALSIINTRFI